MKLRFAILCTLLTGSAALAQAVLPRIAIIRVDNPNVDTYTFGVGQCNDTLPVGWSNTLTTTNSWCTQNPLKIWATSGDCLDTGPGADDTRYADVSSPVPLRTIGNGTFLAKIAELPAFKAATTSDGGTLLPCGSPVPFTKTQKICGSVDYAVFAGVCGTVSHYAAVPLKLVYDTEPPSPPTVTSHVPQDKGVRVSFTVGTDTTAVLIEAQGPTDPDYLPLAEVAVTSTTGSIKGEHLENNVAYSVRLRAKDAAGNVSDPTDAFMETPILTLGFWGFYKNAGGTDGGGCSVGAGLMPLLLAAFAFRRSRKQVRRQP